ncbi:hypothetical protein [Aurantiacibacter gangjinensis]|uniref:Uncharacterized protein n=1 Tax=Aurantiacibacter gangjinensis TaxID=502682 RepID=A0A0G9MRS8_9SPHN|nr:hypothetical protein [Aurantiacibacter gangjinensis]APE26989.1 Permeases of the major facilitator superfamily [Aurantiacibacter gangjinensis]KLE33437.1 hypothetical protein AAW01_05800 [Aurantiacibacter gangjinensis]
MDFMKLIKSLEALLYEVMSWIVFYPRTLFLSVARPLELMQYADTELDDVDEDRYSDTLSPPIFLALTLGLAHLVELSHGWEQLEGILADERNLIAFRLVAFALIPLMFSVRLLKLQNVALDRNTLRPPFYAQCFIAAPFALVVDLGAIFARDVPLVAGIGIIAAIARLLAVQTRWFMANGQLSIGRAMWQAVRAFVTALALIVALSMSMTALSAAA